MNYDDQELDGYDELDDAEFATTARQYGKDRDKFLSLRAWMILVLAVLANEYVSTDSLYPRFKEGRDAIGTAIVELGSGGYLKLSTTFIDGKWIRVNRVTTKGREAILGYLKVVPRDGHFFPTPVDVMSPILTDETRKEIRIAINENKMD
jgi:hypothetical protein